MQKFAKKLTETIISLFGTGGEHDKYRKQETKMLYHALDSYDIAMWGLINFDSFLYGMLGVLGLGGDADTNAAIYGQLAGAYYGYDLIPAEWKYEVYLADEIKDIADKLCAMKSYKIIRTRFEDDNHFKKRSKSHE